MTLKRTTPLLFFLFITIQSSFAQLFKELSQHDLEIDFEVLLKSVEAHPDPYTHISEEEFLKKAEEIKATFDQPHTKLDFYREAASMIALIKDGHSSVRLPEMWVNTARKEVGGFPLKVHLTNDNQLYIIKNYGTLEIPEGAKILAINGISVDSFLNRIDPYISYELTPFRNTLIDNSFESFLYAAFDHSAETEIEYFVEQPEKVIVENIDYREWKKAVKENKKDREVKLSTSEPYNYEKIAEGIGLISIFAFRVPDYNSYQVFLAQTFSKIRRDEIHSLIIDIRGNYGGWPKVSSGLFHYITENHFKTMALTSQKISDTYRNKLLELDPALPNYYFLSGGRHYLDMNALLRNPIGSFADETLVYNEPPQTEIEEFKGQTYLLTNRDSYSAASCFASTFQCYQMGLIIGEETGGTKIFRANPIYIELNRSGLAVGMSTSKDYTTCYGDEFEGVQPHVKYTPTILQLISGRDTQLDYAVYLIRKLKREAEKEAIKSH